jgi:hypothetical protein
MSRVTINDYENELGTDFIKGLEEVLDWFHYTVVFDGKAIKLSSEDDDSIIICYGSLNTFIGEWVDTLEEAMKDDESIDYNDWLEILKANIKE